MSSQASYPIEATAPVDPGVDRATRTDSTRESRDSGWLDTLGRFGEWINLPRRVAARLLLSKAKHPSLRGHPRIARRLAPLIRFYEYDDATYFRADDAPPEIEARRREAFDRLATRLASKKARTIAESLALRPLISDVAFTNTYRVPFPFRSRAQRALEPGCLLQRSDGIEVEDLDGNRALDVSGWYGVNLFGADSYKCCIDRGSKLVGDLGPVLGSYHPIIGDNVRRLLALAKQDEVSFHMSGTEAVMQAVRLARYHTRRSHVVRFCGSYHGWWDGVQAGVGNPRPAHEVYTLKDLSDDTLRVLRTRSDIACVLVNPIQAMHPNANAPSDSMLVSGRTLPNYDKAAYSEWLKKLREVCTQAGIALILDEVFLGFRLAPGGAQEYFGVEADLVTYGKTLGGGLPIGVLCGKARWMRRFHEDRPSDVCFARGTFNSHPYVMGAMNAFLCALEEPAIQETYHQLDARWNSRAQDLNARLERLGFPVRVSNMASIWSVTYPAPGRYHWMFQHYLRDADIALSWIGTGRFIFPNNTTDEQFALFSQRFIAAANAMDRDGWWWSSPALTEKSIRRRLMRESIGAVLSRRSSDRSTHP